MAFRKRNAPLGAGVARTPGQGPTNVQAVHESPVPKASNLPIGVRPSPVDGRPTISTGTASLDSLLAGHAGFALGSSLFIEETGTTDYAGSLLRFYAAEGVVQGHKVHIVGVGEYWGRELPGVTGISDGASDTVSSKEDKEKMKIAWRYERLGEVGTGNVSRGPSKASGDLLATPAFCHTFDLTKRLTLPSPKSVTYLPLSHEPRTSPFERVLDLLKLELSSAPPETTHRLIVPTLLSPALYPQHAAEPTNVLQFLHGLRALLRAYSSRLTAMISLPLTLFPRSSGLTRWIELLCDGVLEIVPFPHTVDAGPPLSGSSASSAQEEKPQGMLRIHRLPICHERGGGGIGSAGVGDDLAFTLSRRRFVIKPYSLPPIEGDQEAQNGEPQGGRLKVNVDF